MSQTYNLGKVAITPRGAYSSTAQYTPLDILSYNGSSYLVLQNCMGITPPNATYYMVVASKGDTGSAGTSTTIAAGTVTMTPAGTSASVTNVGTNVNASFNFTLPNGNVIYTGTGITGTSTTPTVFSGSGVSNAGVGDIYFNTSTVAFYSCVYGGNASTATWTFLTYAVPDGTVTTSKIADSAITRNKIDDGAVGNDELDDGSVSVSKLGSDVSDVLDAKANVDGAYEQMTVGNAEQLVSTVGVSDSAPYNFRTTGGSADVGDRMNLKAVVGGTVAWNQRIPNTKGSGTVATVTVTNNGDGSWTLNGTANANTRYEFATPSINKNHVYLVRGITSGSSTFGYFVASNKGVLRDPFIYNATICKFNGDANQFSFRTYTGATYSDYVVNPQLFDLTAMFGSTIADYAYTLESGTAGAGIAWLKKYGWFTKPYYPYKAAALESVKTSAHKTVGFNQWDEEWEVGGIDSSSGANVVGTNTIRAKNNIRIIPNTVYHYKCSAAAAARYYDASGNYLASYTAAITANSNFTTPSDAAFMRFVVFAAYGTTYKHDICINLHWDGERDGEYEPYEEHTYALDDVELRGIPKLDASNNLYYDGDTYEADGTVTRKYGIVTLNGSESTGLRFTEVSQGNTADGTKYVAYIPAAYNGVKIDGYAVCDAYLWKDGLLNTLHVGEFDTKGSYMRFVLSDQTITTLSALNTYLASHPLTILYELATPTTESADPYTELQICDDFGTEEFVDAATRGFDMPVGHNTVYQSNLRAKLEMTPNSPDGDGLYAVRQSGGINTYEEIIFPTELPSAPTSDGTYRLVCTVADGVATYSWTAN